MWYGAQVAETLNTYAAEYGFQVKDTAFDFQTLKANRQAYIDRIHASYERGFDHNGVERVKAYASFWTPIRLKQLANITRRRTFSLRRGVMPFILTFQGQNTV